MTRRADQPDNDGLPPELLREVNALLSQLCDELLPGEEIDRLGGLLLARPAVRRHYLQYIALHSAMSSSSGGCQTAAPDEDGPPVLAVFDGEDLAALDDQARDLRAPTFAGIAFRRQVWPMAAAILLAMGALVWSLYSFGFRMPPRSTEPLVARPEGPPKRTSWPLVVEITYASPAVRWERTNESYALTSRVGAGQTLSLASGTVELTYG